MGENVASICLSCLELRDGDACPKCGATTERTRAAFEAWERARTKRRVRKLTKAHVLSRAASQKLLASIDGESSESAPESEPRPSSRRGAAQVDRAATDHTGDAIKAATTFSQEIGSRWAALTAAIDSNDTTPSERAPDSDNRRDDAALEAGRAVFAGGAQPVVGAGVDALSALDEDEAAVDPVTGEARPLGALQVFWFIGIILVLAGSVMGVREAWRTLNGVNRQLVIGGALFVYHALFVLLSRVLVKRSHATGRVLAGVASGLLPIAFVAVASAVGTSSHVGVPFAVVLLLASTFTLSQAGGAFTPGVSEAQRRGIFGFAPYLAIALLPSLLLELPLAGAPTHPSMRLYAPMLGLVPILLASFRVRAALATNASTRTSLVALAAATYGAIAVALFAVFGGPNDEALDLSFGTPAQLVTTAWLGLLAAIGWVSAAALQKHPTHGRLGVLLTLLSVALLVSAACAGAVSALSSDSPRSAMDLLPGGLAALAAVIVIAEQRRHLGLLHLVPLTSVVAVLLFARVLLPQLPNTVGLRGVPGLPASLVIVPGALLALSTQAEGKRRTWAAVWGVLSGLIILTVTCAFESVWMPDAMMASGATNVAYSATATTALVLALSAHAGGRTARAWLHVVGALFALAALSSVLVPTRTENAAESLTYACAALAALYGGTALVYPALVKNPDDTRRPLDDVSLLFCVLGLFIAIAGSNPSGVLSLTASDARLLLPRAEPVLSIGALLLLRSSRDRSALLTLLATVAFAYALRLLTNVSTTAGAALLFGLCALATGAVAILRGNAQAPRFGRAFGGFIPLPLGASGATLLDGPALMSAVFAALATACAFGWIGAGGPRTDRGGVVIGMVAVIGACLVAFGTRAMLRFGARGHVATLTLAGAAIGVCAVSNRIGNPLPPAVVGRNLTVILAGVWLLARGIVRIGPRVGKWLQRPTHGEHYHFVPHAGVLALTLLLLVDAWLVGTPTLSRALAITPPMLLVGGALGAFLLYRSFGRAPALHVGLAALLSLFAVAFAQHAVTGPALSPLDPPGGRWVPSALANTLRGASGEWLDPTRFIPLPDTENLLWARALLGAASFVGVASALVLAQSRVRVVGELIGRALLPRAEEEERETILTALSVWACIGALLLGVNLAFVPALAPSVLLAIAGVVLVIAGGRDKLGSAYRAIVIVIGAPLVIHALAQQGATVPAWAGPAFTLLPVGISIASYVAARRRERGTITVTDAELGIASLVAVFYSAGAVAYALAANAFTFPRLAAPSVMVSATDALSGLRDNVTFAPLAITLAALAFASTCTAATWRAGLSTLLGVVPPLLLSLAGVATAAAVVFAARPPPANADLMSILVYGDGALVSATVGIAALVSHVVRVVAQKRERDDVGQGFAVGRDLALIAVLAVTSAFVLGRDPDAPFVAGFRVGPMGVLGLGVAIIVSIDAAVREKTSRHVMLVEILLVALYAFATRELNLRAEIHALLGLGYGFSLLGVAVIARRRNIPNVSVATRRFAVALPILVAVLTAKGMSDGLAMLAFGSSVLYGMMAMVEKSRLLGSLAALAANLALLLFALAQGLDGVEIYVGPLGLLVTALTQLFSPKMSTQGRSAARVVGGMLLYLPAGLKLTLRLGAATDGSYSVVFGAICLLGVVAGLVMQVRAYLVLGTLFITLDVISNLVYAGLRDHRVGFVLLSVSGLLILGIMIMVTLRREAARMLLQRIRGRFRTWD